VHRYSCSTRGFHPSQILSSYSERAPRFSLQQCRETSYSGSENASSFDQKSIINDDIKTINELVNNDPIIMKDWQIPIATLAWPLQRPSQNKEMTCERKYRISPTCESVYSEMAVLTAPSDFSRPHQIPIGPSLLILRAFGQYEPTSVESSSKIARKQLPLRVQKSIKCQNGHPRPISKTRDQIHHKTRTRLIYSLKMFPFPSTWEKK